MNTPLTGRFRLLHTIKHTNKLPPESTAWLVLALQIFILNLLAMTRTTSQKVGVITESVLEPESFLHHQARGCLSSALSEKISVLVKTAKRFLLPNHWLFGALQHPTPICQQCKFDQQESACCWKNKKVAGSANTRALKTSSSGHQRKCYWFGGSRHQQWSLHLQWRSNHQCLGICLHTNAQGHESLSEFHPKGFDVCHLAWEIKTHNTPI